MKFKVTIGSLLLMAVLPASAQMASSHTPTMAPPQSEATMSLTQVTASGNPVLRVNGAVLTDRDLLREMYAIFPYARQHNGFPKSMEREIRSGAKDMLIFEELVYQEAARRNLAVPPARMKSAEAEMRKSFGSEGFKQYLQAEFNGSQQAMRQAIRRSILIDELLKLEVAEKSKVSLAEARASYEKNSAKYNTPETFTLQTISIIPPQNASPAVKKEARNRAEEAAKKAKASKDYHEFGLLAEKYSDDDWHVNMGDRKAVDRAQLPPPVVKAALAMKPGEVSDLIQLGDNYTLFRLKAHTPAGKTKFEAVKDKLRSDMQKEKYMQLRSALNKKLRQKAKIEEL